MPLITNCFVRITRSSDTGPRVLPLAADTAAQAPANMQKLKQSVIVTDSLGGRNFDWNVFYRVRVDVPVDPVTKQPSPAIPAVGDIVEIKSIPSVPYLLGFWTIARIEPDTGPLPSLLLYVRSEYNDAYDQTCYVLRFSETRNDAGEMVRTWAATTVTAIQCMVVPLPGKAGVDEPVVAGKLEAWSYWVVILPVGTDVTEKDRIQVGSVTFEVKSVPTSVQSFKFRMRVVVAEVK